MALEKRRKKIEYKIENQVFDVQTLSTLHKLMRSKFFDSVGGTIAIGKEANVFLAHLENEPLVLKIYRIETSSFKNMLPYIEGDPRFHIKKNKRNIVYTWAKKEFANLKRAYKAEVSVPFPRTVLKNVLVMDLIESEGEPSPMLKNVSMDEETAKEIFEQIISNFRKLYKAGLVHADLSEYNILMQNTNPVLIDFGQAVVLEHPNAAEFLQRDAEKLSSFFGKFGMKTSAENILKQVRSGA